MSKKKKKSPTTPSNSTLQKQADYHLKNQRYKEAIDIYKKLLKQEDRQEWQEKLVAAYLGRAKALAEKGMFKEAIVFWESRDSLCDDKACFSEYIAWLALAGRSPKALRLFISHPTLDTEQNQRLSALFAALLLIGDAELIAVLPRESVLYQHYEIVKEALVAYYQGHDETVRTCLRKIPFRSPYRDFINILRALITLDTDPQSALTLIQQIPVSSPFNGFAQLVRISLLPTEISVEQMKDLDAPEQAFIAHLKGWDKTQMRIISSLQSAVKRDCSTRALFDVVMTNRTFFGDDYSRRFCLASLPDYTGGIKRYEKMFGDLSVFEKARITALNYGRRGKMEESDQEWQKCIDILKRYADQGDNILKAALIFRHLAEKWLAYSNESQMTIEYLVESLQLDPDDKASYHRILELHDKKENLVDYEPCIMAGVERFPHDRELLLAAITIARAEENFEKAIQLAEALTKIDPTSARARQIVLACHLDYIRELIRTTEYKPATELFDQLVQRYPHHGIITINQGLFALQKGETREAKALLLNGIEYCGNDICGQFRLMAEVVLMQIEWKTVSSLVPLPTRRRTYSPTQQEIIALTKVVGEYYAEYSYIFTEELVKPLQSPLKKACTLPFTMDERINVCRLLVELCDYKSLKQYAQVGIAQYPDYHPAFTYFEIYAKTKGDPEELSFDDMPILERAIDISMQANDKLVSTMIMDFFQQRLRAYIPFRLPPLRLGENILLDLDLDEE